MIVVVHFEKLHQIVKLLSRTQLEHLHQIETEAFSSET